MNVATSGYALLIIDMQKDFVLSGGARPCAGAPAVVPFIRQALELFRSRQWPVFHIVREHRACGSDVEDFRKESFKQTPYAVPGTWGWEILDELQPRPGEYLVKKTRFSAFMFTELDALLRGMDVHHLVICGTQYPTCVRSTLFDALALDYRVTLLADAAAARSEEIARANLRDFRDLGVPCPTTAEFLANLK